MAAPLPSACPPARPPAGRPTDQPPWPPRRRRRRRPDTLPGPVARPPRKGQRPAPPAQQPGRRRLLRGACAKRQGPSGRGGCGSRRRAGGGGSGEPDGPAPPSAPAAAEEFPRGRLGFRVRWPRAGGRGAALAVGAKLPAGRQAGPAAVAAAPCARHRVIGLGIAKSWPRREAFRLLRARRRRRPRYPGSAPVGVAPWPRRFSCPGSARSLARLPARLSAWRLPGSVWPALRQGAAPAGLPSARRQVNAPPHLRGCPEAAGRPFCWAPGGSRVAPQPPHLLPPAPLGRRDEGPSGVGWRALA
uniref:nascent polypeptide-associated complex subunit alpha, muscle-specific form-like n=1 Tax=Euleptes europaea TaxID=460621 RepID=UPI0025402D26|nr:nascent polypeptide-associated complex subunit alpha, muscle-specific form-like [Euleptes europaea]